MLSKKLHKKLCFVKEFINISAPHKNISNTGIHIVMNMKRNEAVLLALYTLAKKTVQMGV